ncbi:MAG: hypothetical protein LBF87_01130 [Treponema sp.]|nr:hypothetical protein [Treponema sp.]
MAKRTLAVNSPTPTEVWAYLQETGRQISEMGLKADERLAESRKQMDERLEESHRKTDERLAESRKQMDERLEEFHRQMEERLAESRRKIDERLAESHRKMEEQFAKTDKQIEEFSKGLDETRKIVAETSKGLDETRKIVAETSKGLDETRKIVAETSRKVEEMSRKVEEVSKNLGGIGNMLGDIAEGLLTTDLFEKFHALGYDFEESIANYEACEKGTKRLLAEIDMLMLNGTMALAIEAKTQMTVRDVNQHLKHMALLHSKPNRLLGDRKLYGAMAGIKMTKKARTYAIQKGFFVIEPSGDTVKIEAPAGKPAVW